MMQKRTMYGRSRVGPRDARRPADDLAARRAASRVAARVVADRWPELAGVAPVLTTQQGSAPSAGLLARLGLSLSDIAPRQHSPEYTFTFAGQSRGADCGETPLVAAVTVNGQRRVVKISVTR
jgi:hypothetical protein